MKKLVFTQLILVLLMLVPVNSYAHFLWLDVDNYTPEPGEEITISIAWGHNFPKDSEAGTDRLDKLFIIDPDGEIIPLTITAKGNEKVAAPVKIRLNKKGTNIAVLTKKTGFSSKTTQGYFNKSKKELDGVISSSWSEASAKAIITVGSAGGNALQKKTEQRFQLILLKDPNMLKKGDNLPVKFILDNEPYRTWVYATYSGFSTERDTFAYTTRVNQEDMSAKITILEKGVWLIKAGEKIPYPNPEEADDFSFTCTLTFEVK